MNLIFTEATGTHLSGDEHQSIPAGQLTQADTVGSISRSIEKVLEIEAAGLSPQSGEALLHGYIDLYEQAREALIQIENDYRNAFWQLLPPLLGRADRLSAAGSLDHEACHQAIEHWKEQRQRLNDRLLPLRLARDEAVEGLSAKWSFWEPVRASLQAFACKMTSEPLHRGELANVNRHSKIELTFHEPLRLAASSVTDHPVRIEPLPGHVDDRLPVWNRRHGYCLQLRGPQFLDELEGIRLPLYTKNRLPPTLVLCRLTILRTPADITSPYKVLLGVVPHRPLEATPGICLVTVLEPARPAELTNREKLVCYGGKWQSVDESTTRLHRGFCAARWKASDGQDGVMLIPGEWIADVTRLGALKKAIDRDFARLRRMLKAWQTTTNGRAPRALADSLRRLEDAVSPNAGVRLFRYWRKRRFRGDEEMFAILQRWVGEHERNYETRASLRDRVEAQREQACGAVAEHLAQRYATLIVRSSREDTPQTGDQPAWQDPLRHGQFKRTLAAVAKLHGAHLIRVKSPSI